MCRWLAYSGAPIYLDSLVFHTEHSLIDQSLEAHSSPTTTNGDGFGIGWYGGRETPGLYRHIQPAWNDGNLRDLTAQILSPLYFAHVRAATGTAVQSTNCHPFRHERWLFVHNGEIEAYKSLRRQLMMGIPDEYFSMVCGTTDSELIFYLALGFGLEEDPIGALERTVGFIESLGAEEGVDNILQMAIGFSEGSKIYAVRYSTERRSRTLYHTRTGLALEAICPQLQGQTHDAVAVVSEPLTRPAQDWVEIPESTAVIVEHGSVTYQPFSPR